MGSNIEILPYGPQWEAACERYLARKGISSIYHSRRYIRFSARMLDAEDRTLVACIDNDVVGLLPALARSGEFGEVINSMPFFGTPGGPVADSPSIEELLLEELAAQNRNAASIAIIAHPYHGAGYPRFRHEYEDSRINQTTDLLPEEDEEALWMSIDGSARRNVKKANNSGFEFSVENDEFSILREMHEQNMQAIGGQCKPPIFFEELPAMMREDTDYKLYVARLGGTIAAGLLLLYHGDAVEYFVPGIQPEFRDRQPLAGIIWQAMKDARAKGLRRWNWGGTWISQEGVYRFKRKWAAKDQKYIYYIRLKNKEILNASPERLLSAYPNFYTVPFNCLNSGKTGALDGGRGN